MITLETGAARVVVLPEFGGRVVSLIDRRSGRDWMAQGGISRNTGEDAVFAADEAVGWDECFPTVSRWDATATAWGRKLRDHGDLWGRPCRVESRSATLLQTIFTGTGFRFERLLSLAGDTLTADYRVANIGREPLPFLWALHGLLATLPGEHIVLPGVERVASAYLSVGGKRLSLPDAAWPGPNPDLPFPLDRVQPVESLFAGKLYVPDQHTASVGGDNGWLDMTWHGIDHLGIWFTYGAWPVPGDIHHVALEPTSSPADHLGQAIERGEAMPVSPGSSTSWRVTMTLSRPQLTARPSGVTETPTDVLSVAAESVTRWRISLIRRQSVT